MSVSFVMSIIPSACRPAYPHVPARHQPDGFPWKLILGTSVTVCRETSDMVKRRTKISGILPADLSAFYCCRPNKFAIKSFFLQHLVPLCCLQWFVVHLYSHTAELSFHFNDGYANAPQYHVICTLLILFHTSVAFPLSLRRKDLSQNPVLEHPQTISSLNVRDQFHTYVEHRTKL